MRARGAKGGLRRVAVAVFTWGMNCSAGIMGFAALWPGAFWATSLLSELLPQVVILLVGGLVALAAFRRWFSLGICSALIVLIIFGSWLERTPQVRSYDPEREFSVRIMQFNTLSSNEDSESVLRVIRGAEADVVSIIEPSNALIGALRDMDALRDTHPFRWIPETAGAGWSVVLSKHPQRVVSGSSRWPHGTLLGRGRRLVVEDPRGAYVFVQMLPESPRSPARWRKGNQTTRDVCEAIRSVVDAERLPVLVAGDINGSPTGLRGRLLRSRGGVLHTKPRFRVGGTWPARAPGPLRIHIDDVLVGDGVNVLSWDVVPYAAGSDHLPVVVEVVLPRRGDVPASAE